MRITSSLIAQGAIGLGVALAALHLSAAQGQPAKNDVVKRVEQVLRQRITSTNDSLKIDLQPDKRVEQGYFSQVNIEGKPLRIKNLTVTEFSLHATNVHISVPALSENKIRTIQTQTKLRVVVAEDDLTQMFSRGRHTKNMGLKVKYVKDAKYGDIMQVSGNWAWSWFSGPVVGTGKLRVTADNKVYADIISLKLNGAEVPGFVKNKFSDSLNPVLDYDDVPFQPRFRTLKVEGNRAILTA